MNYEEEIHFIIHNLSFILQDMGMETTPDGAIPTAHQTSNERLPDALGELRREIDAIDKNIVELLAQRHRCVQQVVALKTAHRIPVYHPAREEDLISQRREQATQAGMDPDHIEELYRSILRQSRVRQTVQVTRIGVRPGAKVLIVGGRGKMGQYFNRWFSGAGYEVRILDISDWPRAQELCQSLDLALVCVPIGCTVEVINNLAPFLGPQCLLADITSVKKPALEAMLASHQGPVIGFHPLFGPTTSTMDKQVVAAIPGRDSEACQWLIDQFISWGNIVLSLDAEEHDEIMSIVQSLRHFAVFTFGEFLCRRNVNLGKTLELSSPIYRLELGMIGRLFAQDPSLYAEIILATPERKQLLQDYIDALNAHKKMIETGDKETFCAQFKQVTEWFGPFCGQALRESNFLIEKLVERF